MVGTLIKFFNWDLGKSPKENWDPIFEDFDIQNLKLHLNKIINPYRHVINMLKFGLNFVDIMYQDELNFLAKKLNLSLMEVLMLQLIYETSSACTSAILETSEGPLFFRTMDWPYEFLKSYTIGLTILKDGKKIAKTITWLGYIGYLTVAHLKKKYVIAINYRRTKEINLTTILNNAVRTFNMAWPIGYLVREIVNNPTNLSSKEVLKKLENSPLISPCYITFYSTKIKSRIITRDADKTVSCRKVDLIQTNCDWNKSAPNILYSVERRAKVYPLLKTDLPKDKVLDKLLEHPIINEETIYVFIMFGNKIKCFVT